MHSHKGDVMINGPKPVTVKKVAFWHVAQMDSLQPPC